MYQQLTTKLNFEIPTFMLKHAKEKTIELVCECVRKELEAIDPDAPAKTVTRGFEVYARAGNEHAIAP